MVMIAKHNSTKSSIAIIPVSYHCYDSTQSLITIDELVTGYRKE